MVVDDIVIARCSLPPELEVSCRRELPIKGFCDGSTADILEKEHILDIKVDLHAIFPIYSMTLLIQPSMFRYSNWANLPTRSIPISRQYSLTMRILAR